MVCRRPRHRDSFPSFQTFPSFTTGPFVNWESEEGDHLCIERVETPTPRVNRVHGDGDSHTSRLWGRVEKEPE